MQTWMRVLVFLLVAAFAAVVAYLLGNEALGALWSQWFKPSGAAAPAPTDHPPPPVLAAPDRARFARAVGPGPEPVSAPESAGPESQRIIEIPGTGWVYAVPKGLRPGREDFSECAKNWCILFTEPGHQAALLVRRLDDERRANEDPRSACARAGINPVPFQHHGNPAWLCRLRDSDLVSIQTGNMAVDLTYAHLGSDGEKHAGDFDRCLSAILPAKPVP